MEPDRAIQCRNEVGRNESWKSPPPDSEICVLHQPQGVKKTKAIHEVGWTRLGMTLHEIKHDLLNDCLTFVLKAFKKVSSAYKQTFAEICLWWWNQHQISLGFLVPIRQCSKKNVRSTVTPNRYRSSSG